MGSRKHIRVQACVIESIAVIANEARRAIIKTCRGIDDMQHYKQKLSTA